MSKEVSLKQSRVNTILESIYRIVTYSESHSRWVKSYQYDGRTLHGMWKRGLIEINGGFVTLTEKGMGVLLFGDNAEEILKYVFDGTVC